MTSEGPKLAGALFNEEGVLLHRIVRPLDKREGSEVGLLIQQVVQELMEQAALESRPVAGIGISVPGIAYVEKGEVWAPNIPGWDNYPLIQELKDQLQLPSVPIVLESDRSCYILGEKWKGAARDCQHAIYMAVGTGIGAGILIDGKVLRGSGNIAGAVGWLALDRPYKPKYDACGCYEYHASGPGLAKVAAEWIQKDPSYQGPLANRLNTLTAKDIFEQYIKQDPIAIRVLDEAIRFWGMALANLISIFNPEKIIFGGGVFGPAGQFLDKIKTEATQWAQPISMQQVSLEVSQLGADTGLIGAGYLALRASSP